MSLNDRIVEEARKWSDVNYLHRGFTKQGCDCSGLLVGVMKSLGFLKNFVMPIYPIDWNLHNCKHNFLTETIPNYCNSVNHPEKKPGDLLLFRFGKNISHAAILVDNSGLFIHCYKPRGTCYGTLSTDKWAKRLVEVWRIDEDKVKQN